ncbi:MAG: ABC transporter permease [Firmicutes bacterium]|nr:ABC transporter permease [Bacillota bacterium]MCL1953845.1 ABC transporter permease [Bacillota bacterium]
MENKSPVLNYFKNTWNAKGVKQIISVLVGTLVLVVVFASINPNFVNNLNIRNMIREMAPYIVIGIGQGFVLITGNIDLSIGSVYGASSMISASLMANNGVSPIWAILIALLVSVVIGFVNGQLVSRFKLPPFIATLGTMFVGRGIAYMANNARPTDNISVGIGKEVADGFQKFFYGSTFGILSSTILIALVVWVIAWLFLSKTKYGRHVYAVGSNKEAAKLSGVNVGSTTTMAFMISAFCAGFAGIIGVAQTSSGSLGAGTSYEMYAVAVAVIGGISTLGGAGLLQGVIVGSMMWVVLQRGLTLINLNDSYQMILLGFVVVIAVGADVLMRKLGANKQKKLTLNDGNKLRDSS